MKRIGYLLHRFPRVSDTFIRREIRSLQQLGSNVQVISVWTPGELDTTPYILSQWSDETHFLLPKPAFYIARTLVKLLLRYPGRFFRTFQFAVRTSRPGVRGLIYQLFYFVEAVLAAEILCRDSFDHVHNHIGDQSGTVTMFAAKLAGISYSISFHGWPVFYDAKNSRIKEKVLGAKFIRSISHYCSSQLLMFSGIESSSSLKVIHCGVKLSDYTYRIPREEVKRILSIVRMVPEKGLSFLLNALRMLTERHYDLELSLAGDGPSKPYLQTLAQELGIHNRVHFLGFLDEDQIARELALSDIFVLPSFVEGVPVSAMEAMATGVPVVATNVGGTSELVEDGRTGLLVRPADSEALASAIARYIENYSLRLSTAELGRKKVEAEFDVDKECAKLNYYLLNGS